MPAHPEETPVPLAEISQGPNAFEQFLDRNQKNIAILAVLLVIGTAAFVIYRGINQSREEDAGANLVAAEDLAKLQAVVVDHSGTAASGTAMILLANRQWEEGQQDASIQTLRDFLAKHQDHPGRATAQASLGAKLMTQGKADEAISIFDELVNNPEARFVAPYALINIGDMAKAAGDKEKAKASYDRVVTEFPESSFVDTATRRLAMLDAKAPVAIDPPPAPAKPNAETPTAPGTATPPAPPAPVAQPNPAAPEAPAQPTQTTEKPSQEPAANPGSKPESPETPKP